MKTLYKYIRESLLDDIDLQPEINDLLFSYIFNFNVENQYIKAIDYLIANSKLIKKNLISHIKHKQNSVCVLVLNKDKNGKIITPIIIAGIMGDLDKSIIIYWNDETQSVGRATLRGISTYIGANEFKTVPLYELKSNALINNFRKLNY